ncbi:MAG: response regulator [Betaproteobacteria bacterium]|nr:response regulator [Betaproteobacteria bacterium]
MSDKSRAYQLTAAGRSAWESQDTAVPEDYRRILWLMDFHGQDGVVGELLRRYPRNVLDEWLAEMEDLGLIEVSAAGQEGGSTFSTREADRTLGLDQARLKRSGEAASLALARTGAYISADRLSRRPAPRKPPADCVVLIVEDDPDQLALADLRVSMAGYRVRVAKSVNEFLHSMLDEGAPDLLLLDVVLPDGNGFELLAKMRRHAVLGSLPIVMLTAENEAADVGKGLLLGADGYITKPYTKNILADVIRRVLKQDGGA